MPSIAIIGASADRAKYGNKAVRAYLKQGYTVYPVNPTVSEIEGLRVYSTVSEIPETPDAASFYIPPSKGLAVIEDIAAKGIKRVWLNPGAESEELVRRAGELGIEAIVACSILAIDESPSEFS